MAEGLSAFPLGTPGGLLKEVAKMEYERGSLLSRLEKGGTIAFRGELAGLALKD